eukprot:SAG31_NODE_22100_length_533_cov_20.693548_1_plen_95_part_00
MSCAEQQRTAVRKIEYLATSRYPGYLEQILLEPARTGRGVLHCTVRRYVLLLAVPRGTWSSVVTKSKFNGRSLLTITDVVRYLREQLTILGTQL